MTADASCFSHSGAVYDWSIDGLYSQLYQQVSTINTQNSIRLFQFYSNQNNNNAIFMYGDDLADHVAQTNDVYQEIVDKDYFFVWPELTFEIGAETFYHIDTQSGNMMGGLAAIMIDISGKVNDRFSFFGAFHFDSSPWYELLNTPLFERQEAAIAYDIDLEVEEFFLDWKPLPGRIELRAGRRFSRLSYANQLHLADFEFNMKPRIYTSYWGNNHGLALDGLSLELAGGGERVNVSILAEAAKNNRASDHAIVTTVVDARYAKDFFDIGLRGFAYFDHQTERHPFLIHLYDDDLGWVGLNSGMGLNAWGGGFKGLWGFDENRFVHLQAEWVYRKIGNDFLTGMYAFLQVDVSEKITAGVMYQNLEMPVFTEHGLHSETEKAYTAGLSYFPQTGHRLRIEYSNFSNSTFYNDMIVVKWTFFFLNKYY